MNPLLIRIAMLAALLILLPTSLTAAQDGTLRRIRVPVLMYHYVGPLPQDADPLRVGLTVRPEEFREQLAWLKAAGYRSITFGQLHDALENGAELPPKPVILSFDDGHLDHFTTVMPLLQEAGFSGTFFIISERVEARDPAYMDREQIAALVEAGMQIEAHGRSHRDLAGRGRDLLVYELLGSRESLQAWTGAAPAVVAWPFGSHDDLARQIAREAGYLMAVSTRAGVLHSNTGLHDLARLRVNRNLTLRSFEALLRADWLEAPGAPRETG